MVFDPTQGYEVIHHGAYTQTGGPHLHIGHYAGNAHAGYVLFKTEGLTKATKGHYHIDKRAIPKAEVTVQ